ncbi:AMP-binding protein [Sorangium sp. So ce176]|uniref:AMP-binding protein n=1 Tax=Sorangium sp. So ce176 TaxID=3133286 RepID=UPI003F6033B6
MSKEGTSSMNIGSPLPPVENALDLFRHYATSAPEARIAVFIEEEGQEQGLTYRELERAATNLSLELGSVAAPGDRVLVAYDSGPMYLVGVWAALYAGMIAVPVDPLGPDRPAANVTRLLNVTADSGATVCVASRSMLDAVKSHPGARQLTETLRWVVPSLPDLLGRAPGSPPAARWTEKDVAMLQYASGSTGAPKGTIVTHASLLMLARALLISTSADSPFGRPDVEVTWLPLTHSTAGYGLIMKCLTGATMSAWYIAPSAFARSPAIWLRTISRHKGKQVYSVAPNFALDWCVSSTTEAERKQLDLSCWTHVMSMGEKVRPETWKAFSDTFRESGFRPKLFIAGYGMSETGYVSGSVNGGKTVRFDRAAMDEGSLVEAPEGGILLLSSSGFILPGVRVAIVDPETREVLPEGKIGEIWVSTPTAMTGYWNRPEETEQQFHARTADGSGPFFRSGDMGAFYGGNLFVTGRRKSIVVIRGRKHYAEDIESTLERTLDWLGANSSIAFADDVNGVEELFIAVDPRGARDGVGFEERTDALRSVVAREFGIRVHEVLFLAAGQLPRTSMGKVSRVSCKDLFRSGELEIAARSGSIARGGADLPAVDLRAILDEPDAELRVARMAEHIRSLLSASLSVPADALSLTKSFDELGVDSMTGVRFRGELVRAVGLELPESIVYNYPTIAQLASFVCEKLTGTAGSDDGERADRGPAALAALDVESMSEETAAAALRAHLDGRK